ncbi:hypothetical protein [Spirosoma sp. KUDC1026]|uniref:hypothetical protein n=1 Tax=Spirosoma sp. KUDC1026 TaxID=2745947 RepID=UPI00159BA80C|nr:hypothetical protein [Spirosoma sp. KUDC1026]QKZ11761.1 hypothetical protein HU175_03605 [Spirosoma sp. KUDC1026]
MRPLMNAFFNFQYYVSQPVYQTPLSDRPDHSLVRNLRQFANESALFLFLMGFTMTFGLAYIHVTGNHLFRDLIEKYQSRMIVLVVSLLIAVTLEEGLFRAILRMTQQNLRYIATVLTFLLIGVWYKPLKELVGPMVGFGMIGVWFVTSLVLDRYLKRPAVFARVLAFWQANFGKLFYVTSLVYALVKIADDISWLTGWQLLFVPALLGLSLISGFYFGYVRMKYGFWYAVAVHSLILAGLILSEAVLTL